MFFYYWNLQFLNNVLYELLRQFDILFYFLFHFIIK